MELLQGEPALRYLSLGGPQVTDAWMTSVRKLASLAALNLRDSPVTADGLARLESLPNLQRLTLQGKWQVTEPELARLKVGWPDVLISRELGYD